jgi:hypothetical protein
MRTEQNKYKGLTKKNYKRLHGSSTSGREKGENCHATGLDKALAKYPRSFKTMPDEYASFYQKKDKASKRI